MNRPAAKPGAATPQSARQRQRPASLIRSAQQVLQPVKRARIPEGLTAGVVRRVSDSVPHAPIIPPITRANTAEAAMPRGIPQPMSPVEFCRQARRLRAVLENDPVRLHKELSQLNAAASAEEAAPARKSQVIDWTWMQTTKFSPADRLQLRSSIEFHRT